MRLNSRIQQKQDTAANWKNNNPVLLSGEFGYETDTGKVKIGNGSSHWNDIDYVGGGELPTDPTFNSLVVGEESSTSGSANLIADEMGVTITKNDSAIDVNEDGVDIQSTNVNLSSKNGTLLNVTDDGVHIALSENPYETGNYDDIKPNATFAVTTGSWPTFTINSGDSGYDAKVDFFTSDFNIMNIGYNGPMSIDSQSGIKFYGEADFADEVKQNGKPLATKEYVDSKGGYPEIIDLLD